MARASAPPIRGLNSAAHGRDFDPNGLGLAVRGRGENTTQAALGYARELAIIFLIFTVALYISNCYVWRDEGICVWCSKLLMLTYYISIHSELFELLRRAHPKARDTIKKIGVAILSSGQ